jgi:hypothetical protein
MERIFKLLFLYFFIVLKTILVHVTTWACFYNAFSWNIATHPNNTVILKWQNTWTSVQITDVQHGRRIHGHSSCQKLLPYHQTQLFILRVCSENGTVTWGSLTNLPQGMGTFEAWNQTTLEFVYAYAWVKI